MLRNLLKLSSPGDYVTFLRYRQWHVEIALMFEKYSGVLFVEDMHCLDTSI